ncbi:MAG: DUF1569 domain-containing protein [Pyrinomonadaceae bacterium]
MKTIFENAVHEELLNRLNKLEPNSERQWGKMSPSQMMEHTARGLEMATGRKPMKQMFVGKLLSWIFRKEFLGEKPFQPDRPTGSALIVRDDPDFEPTRARLSERITELHNRGESATEGTVHGFFGPLTGKQWGETQYKHVDHHLRQFGV